MENGNKKVSGLEKVVKTVILTGGSILVADKIAQADDVGSGVNRNDSTQTAQMPVDESTTEEESRSPLSSSDFNKRVNGLIPDRLGFNFRALSGFSTREETDHSFSGVLTGRSYLGEESRFLGDFSFNLNGGSMQDSTYFQGALGGRLMYRFNERDEKSGLGDFKGIGLSADWYKFRAADLSTQEQTDFRTGLCGLYVEDGTQLYGDLKFGLGGRMQLTGMGAADFQDISFRATWSQFLGKNFWLYSGASWLGRKSKVDVDGNSIDVSRQTFGWDASVLKMFGGGKEETLWFLSGGVGIQHLSAYSRVSGDNVSGDGRRTYFRKDEDQYRYVEKNAQDRALTFRIGAGVQLHEKGNGILSLTPFCRRHLDKQKKDEIGILGVYSVDF